MEASFWHELWENGQTGFHEGQINRMLTQYAEQLALSAGSRVLLPLCGKTQDIQYFLARGIEVVGVELYEPAIRELFEILNVTPTISQAGAFTVYQAPKLTIYVGDFFAMDKSLLGPVDAIYDRAALVALPEPMRIEYSEHLMTISNLAKQLLICFEYDQSKMSGPPFAVTAEMVEQYYGSKYRINHLDRELVAGGLKGIDDASESVWLLDLGISTD
ncbi:thiopurine S-methyltransferase [Pseudoalteromonas piscicida]|uniref:Thiopurine S-methyltransferase n=1 Tax=Pseudoalteromonas piscicida TaxID=43662 RepID=A0A2A5JL62_PSEO7|nr:thiopurine S-methyltransferase [Pseudoalteromonas piscicida]PCK30182.1 thiopurine S-methyltransferase [Pseudoalteromonas piscicida]